MRIAINDQTVELSARLARIIRRQPGYSPRDCDGRPQQRRLQRGAGDYGLRLFVRPGRGTDWADASLRDIEDAGLYQVAVAAGL